MEYKEIILYPKQNIEINSTENNIAEQTFFTIHTCSIEIT